MAKTGFETAKHILDEHLESGNRRKTPERYSILEYIYEYKKLFTLYELQTKLEAKKLFVSRGTVYNTLKMFVELRIVIRHNMEGETLYEPAFTRHNHCCQICTSCGKVKTLSVRNLPALRNNIPVTRFRPEGFHLVIYGICSNCIANITKKKRKEERELAKQQKIEALKEKHNIKVQETKSQKDKSLKAKQ